jgi:phospholipase/lecithinase/hemolysin
MYRLGRSLQSLAVALCTLFLTSAGHAQVYSEVVVFGDSNVDSGYYRALSNPGSNATFNGLWPAAVAAGAGVPTTRPGLMNSEHLAAYFGHTLLPANVSGGTNYATSGAKNVDVNTATNGGFREAIPTATQIANFLASRGGVANATALYGISSGANDISFAVGDIGSGPYPADPTAYVQSRARGLAEAIGTLRTAGAQTIIVAVVPESFPLSDPTVQALRVAYNSALFGRLSQLGVTVIPANFNQTRLDMVANPAAFGFATVSNTNPACTQPSGITAAWSLLCSSASGAPSTLVAPNADMRRLFADESHLGTHGQKILANYIYSLLPQPTASPLAASVLPTSRSVQVGQSATAFATIINSSNAAVNGCRISPVTNVFSRFSFQTTNASNQLTGTTNAPVTIPAGGAQSFVIAFTPTTAAMSSRDVRFAFVCANTPTAVPLTGINTLQLTFDDNPVPDLIMIGGTPSGDGYARTGGPSGTGVLAASAVNIGAAGTMTVSARKLNAQMPLNIFICQTNPATAQCLAPPAPTVTLSVGSNQTTTWSVFLAATGTIPENPATNRVFLEFSDATAVRGSTSTAVTTVGGGS